MPKTLHGKPVPEHKWETAKQSASAQGRAGDYGYIMGILKRMMGMGKRYGKHK